MAGIKTIYAFSVRICFRAITRAETWNIIKHVFKSRRRYWICGLDSFKANYGMPMPAWSCMVAFWIKCFASAKSHSWSKILRTTEPKFYALRLAKAHSWQAESVGACGTPAISWTEIATTSWTHSTFTFKSGEWCAVSAIRSAFFVWKEWLLYCAHVDNINMEFACWVIKILVIVILGFNGCQRPLDNQGPRSLNKQICDSKLRVCIICYHA